MAEVQDEERRSYDQTVDPVLRAHVQSLVTALGGPANDGSGGYMLGDEAQFVLRDLKKWLKGYDEKLNRLDVARCLAEANLVAGDLVEILASWPEDKTDSKAIHRIMLSTVELLVALTWPLDKPKEQLTVNQHRHSLYIKIAQAGYKRALLHHPSGKVLASCVRVALPSLAIPAREREPRDEGILKLLLYLIRNITIIKHPSPSDTDTGDDISPSATINAFEAQGILQLVLTAASGMGEDFKVQDVVVMEIIYHLTKGVDIAKLFMSDKEVVEKEKKGLDDLLKMEKGLETKAARNAPTRHNRFGTQIWINRGDGRMSTVSGQDALVNREIGMDKMDKSKKWRRPNYGRKTDLDEAELPVRLESTARQNLKAFVEDFLDAGFNPLFMHVRRAIDHDEDRFLQANIKQYFHLMAWFLEAERIRRRVALENNSEEVADSFALVAGVLNQESLIVLNRYLREWFDLKQWIELQAAMRSLTQILLTVQDMSISPLEEDQDIAENIQNRMFYEEATLELVQNIVKGYTRQSFGYLDSCTELGHVYLRMLEKYSKQNTHMFIRSRRVRKTKKAKGKEKAKEGEDARNEEGSAAEEERENRAAVQEKEFNFVQFESKFLTQQCVETYMSLLKYYNELSYAQVKRIIAFFHRVFVKRQMEVVMFRLDYLELFYRICQGADGMPTTHPGFKEIDQFARFYIKKLVKKLQATPALFTEILFTKDSGTYYYLQHGVDKEPKKSISTRQPAEWEVKKSVAVVDQVPVVVAVLKDTDKLAHVKWIKAELQRCLTERKAWDAEMAARKLIDSLDADGENAGESSKNAELPPDYLIRPDTEERKIACQRDGTVRLLLTLSSAELATASDPNELNWVIPGYIPTKQLEEKMFFLNKATDEPIVLPEGQKAADLIRRKPAARRYLSTDSEGDDDDTDLDGFLERRGGGGDGSDGGNLEFNSYGSKKKKKKAKKLRRSEREPLNDSEAERRREKRRQEDDEKQQNIKSSVYVHDSDDEMNSEDERKFFEREMEIRKIVANLATKPALDKEQIRGGTKKRKNKKAEENAIAGATKRRRVNRMVEENEEENSDEEPSSSVVASPKVRKVRPRRSSNDEDAEMRDVSHLLSSDSDADSESDAVSTPRATAAKVRVPLVSDDEDEEEASSENELPALKSGGSDVGGGLQPGSFSTAFHSNDEEADGIPMRGAKRRARVIDDDDDEE